uniref:Si:ch211-191d15.2 n=1 Tax=Neolamprologus brichardi TaxID=32507 RepID=A0A3Q4GTR7_NEOBR
MLWCRCGVLLALCICPLACLAVSPCPTGCCCPGFLVLCESLGLRSLPRSVPLSTSALSVARNQLCNVDHQLWPFSGLQELSLSHNLLARFPRGLPPSLESLQLQENRITYITSGVLRQLGNLTHLDLEDNRIRAIQPGALQGLHKLQVLKINSNCLRGRLKMATDIVCTEPDHLAHRLLLNLSVVAICPRVLKPNDRTHERDLSFAQARMLTVQPAEKISKLATNGLLSKAPNSNQDSSKTLNL